MLPATPEMLGKDEAELTLEEKKRLNPLYGYKRKKSKYKRKKRKRVGDPSARAKRLWRFCRLAMSPRSKRTSQQK